MRTPALVALVSLWATPLLGQAWVAPAHSGSVSASVQRIDNTGHRLTDGTLIRDGKSTDQAVFVEAEYAFSDRLSAAVGLPLVFARYNGPNPTPFVFLPVDSCFCWHGGWQDVGVTGRYNIVGGRTSVTASVAAGVPTHDYSSKGEAVLGRHLNELRFGIDAGRRLDVVSPRLSVQGHYTYAVVQRVLDISNNRSNYGVDATVLLSRTFSARALLSWQRTHGGLRFLNDLTTPERIEQHDRLLRDNHFDVGMGASYSLPRLDFFASFIGYASGTDSHAGRALTVGVSWPFEFAP